MLSEESVAKSDNTHTELGLFAVDSYNGNCWAGAAEYLRNSGADALCLQETKVEQGQALAEAEAGISTCGWKAAIQPCAHAAEGGRSAGVAVAVRGHMGLGKPLAEAVGGRPEVMPRLAIHHWSAVCRGGVGLGACYLVAGCGVTNSRNQSILQEAANQIRSWQGPWILGGDFNCSPEELTATGWLNLVDGVIHATKEATCLRRTLDYFVVARNFSHAVASVNLVGDSACTPHAAVRLYLKAGARADTVRELRTIPKLPAVLPHGPMNRQWHKPAPDSPEELAEPIAAMKQAWMSYGTTVAAVEEELCELMQADELDRQRHNRQEGPSHVVKTLCNTSH